MKIDFNNARLQALYVYDRLCQTLNTAKEYEGYALVDPNTIQPHMDELRQILVAIASTYQPDDPDFKDVYTGAFKNGHQLKSFEFETEEE